MKKIKKSNDQKNNEIQDPIQIEDLQADLETRLGDGDLFEHEKMYYYAPKSGGLYEVDFDSSKITEDFTTTDEVSDSNDPHEIRTDSVEGSCPHNKNKKKQKSATNMKKIEQADTYNEETDKKKSMADEDEEETKDTVEEEIKEEVKEDMKTEDNTIDPPKPNIEPNIEELKSVIKDLVKETVEDLTKEIREERDIIIQGKVNDLVDLLQKKPYSYTVEDLTDKNLKDLEQMKSLVERSGLFKDFQERQKTLEQGPIDVDKDIFNSTDDFENKISDPWRSFKNRGGS